MKTTKKPIDSELARNRLEKAVSALCEAKVPHQLQRPLARLILQQGGREDILRVLSSPNLHNLSSDVKEVLAKAAYSPPEMQKYLLKPEGPSR